MKKSFMEVLLLTVSFPVLAGAGDTDVINSQTMESAAGAYELDAAQASAKMQQNEPENTVSLPEKVVADDNKDNSSAPENMQNDNKPKIMTEKTADGYIEKLIAPDGKVVAEKTVKDGEIIKKVLNYYYPNGKLKRRVTAYDKSKSFYAEDYYMNDVIASQATYLNEENKIGIEKIYDNKGTLRQEIPWVEAEKEGEKSPVVTVRKGKIKTYYPRGSLAAVFDTGEKNGAVFYNEQGEEIRRVENAKILNFAQDIDENACKNSVVKLSLEELAELYEDEGDISYNKCGLPYRENFVYETTDVKGASGLRVSYDETGMIRRMTPYLNGLKNGVEQKFDATGNLTAEINYRNGVKDGTASGFFPTGDTAFRKRYNNGKVEGKLICYFPTGEVAAEISYKSGKKEGVAKIYGPNVRDIVFANGEIVGQGNHIKTRAPAVSKLGGLEQPDTRCLDASSKIEELTLELEANANTVASALKLDMPQGCTDFSSFKPENSNYACYDALNRLRAIYPTAYNRGEYAVGEVYSPEGTLLYSVPYYQKKKQGTVRKFDGRGQVVAEISYDRDEPAESSRSYYENGAVKEMLTISDDAARKLLVRYNPDGTSVFSLSYSKGEKNEAFLANPQKNKDIYVKFYQGKIDDIREINASNPQNYIEYNFATGEYTVYKNNELIKGGKICGYENIAEQGAVSTKPEPAETVVQKTLEAEAAPSVDEEKNKKVIPATVTLDGKDKTAETVDEPVLKEETYETAPVLPVDAAPMVEDLEPISFEDIRVKNAIIPTAEEKKQAELAAKNIGPVARPDIEELTDVVAKEHVGGRNEKQEGTLSKTEKFYYPNGNLRKTIKTRGGRTEEVKEYSKTGLLITDTVYNKDSILIEKYFGSGEIRRKTHKAYSDNSVTAFVSREDFYDNGNPRYEITRKPDTLLFSDKLFYPDGTVKQTVEQTGALSFSVKEYDKGGKLQKSTEQLGADILEKEYNAEEKAVRMLLNQKEMPLSLEANSAELLKDNLKTYAVNGGTSSEFKADSKQNTLAEYFKNGKPKTEIVFYNNGEISVKVYEKNGTLIKFAYLAPDGKLHIQKPAVRVIPAYRERYWVDYNNPLWIENRDKYSVRSMARLSLDTASHILAELEIPVPEIMKKMYEVYK